MLDTFLRDCCASYQGWSWLMSCVRFVLDHRGATSQPPPADKCMWPSAVLLLPAALRMIKVLQRQLVSFRFNVEQAFCSILALRWEKIKIRLLRGSCLCLSQSHHSTKTRLFMSDRSYFECIEELPERKGSFVTQAINAWQPEMSIFEFCNSNQAQDNFLSFSKD